MSLRLKAALAALLVIMAAGCAPETQQSAAGGHPAAIIVREFAASPEIVTLDPSFGFSLYRGMPGVPREQRAAAVGRAAAFSLADTIAEQLRAAGYDAVRSNSLAAEPGGKALTVTGAFTAINEGHRRHVGAGGATVAADFEIAYQAGSAAPTRLTVFQLDSRQTLRDQATAVAATRAADINAAATRLGKMVARTVADLARRNNWPGAPR